jgi:hypothetical protein
MFEDKSLHELAILYKTAKKNGSGSTEEIRKALLKKYSETPEVQRHYLDVDAKDYIKQILYPTDNV